MRARAPAPHPRLGQSADLVIVAPATAKVLGKYASGISDDLLPATPLATRAPVPVPPAKHADMGGPAGGQEDGATPPRTGANPADAGAGGTGGPGPGPLVGSLGPLASPPAASCCWRRCSRG